MNEYHSNKKHCIDLEKPIEERKELRWGGNPAQ